MQSPTQKHNTGLLVVRCHGVASLLALPRIPLATTPNRIRLALTKVQCFFRNSGESTSFLRGNIAVCICMEAPVALRPRLRQPTCLRRRVVEAPVTLDGLSQFKNSGVDTSNLRGKKASCICMSRVNTSSEPQASGDVLATHPALQVKCVLWSCHAWEGFLLETASTGCGTGNSASSARMAIAVTGLCAGRSMDWQVPPTACPPAAVEEGHGTLGSSTPAARSPCLPAAIPPGGPQPLRGPRPPPSQCAPARVQSPPMRVASLDAEN